MFKRSLLVLVAVVFLATSAWAGNCPEFDAVCLDSDNYFNDAIRDMVVENVTDGFGAKINEVSAFPYDPITDYGEYFAQTAGALYPDPCFPDYLSALTDTWNEAVYEWQIVLQMKPESDIDLNIVDCVMKHNEFNVWTGTEQTGRYRAPWGQLMFIRSANPSVSVVAKPGPWATPGFVDPLIMDARKHPTLGVLPLDGKLYTSKALWEETIVMVLPETGARNCSDQDMYNLKQGDQLTVTVVIPGNNTCDIRYGQDNVSVEYIGIVYTELTGEVTCELPE